MPTWDSNQYLQFADQRTRPCRDLAARVNIAAPRRVIDLGCGPGNSTAVLMERWPASQITGLDSSPQMIESARNHIMPSAQAILEWYKGTGLRPFLDALNSDERRAEFLESYIQKLSAAYRPQSDGKFLFPFRRLFIIAYRGK